MRLWHLETGARAESTGRCTVKPTRACCCCRRGPRHSSWRMRSRRRWLTVADDVVNLGRDLVVREGGKVGEGLEELRAAVVRRGWGG